MGGNSDRADGFFGPPPADWQAPKEAPEIKAGLDWLLGFMRPGEWEKRRAAAADRLYAASGGGVTDPNDPGRFFETRDTLGWYLFLSEAILQHPWNYEPMFGSRVLPVMASIGRNLSLLKQIYGIDTRIKRLVHDERAQPNGGIFELLVASAYARAGGNVGFVPEQKGIARTHDFEARLGEVTWAVECKRMETSEYGGRERSRMRRLWGPASASLELLRRSVIAIVDFKVEIDRVPDDYLLRIVHHFVESRRESWLWDDRVASVSIGNLDLKPLQSVLSTEKVLTAGTRMQELLTGHYQRDANMITALQVRCDSSPRYADACSLAVVLRWSCLAEESVSAKARDILNKLADATGQLPDNKPSVVHIGIEAVDGETVERARLEKVLSTMAGFDPRGKPLEYVACHHLVPESPPGELYAFEETYHWTGIRPTRAPPITNLTLVTPPGVPLTPGFFWQSRGG